MAKAQTATISLPDNAHVTVEIDTTQQADGTGSAAIDETSPDTSSETSPDTSSETGSDTSSEISADDDMPVFGKVMDAIPVTVPVRKTLDYPLATLAVGQSLAYPIDEIAGLRSKALGLTKATKDRPAMKFTVQTMKTKSGAKYALAQRIE